MSKKTVFKILGLFVVSLLAAVGCESDYLAKNYDVSGTTGNYCRSIDIDSKNNVLAIGTVEYASAETDIYVMKTNSTGECQWFMTYGGASYDESNGLPDIKATSDGGSIFFTNSNSWGQELGTWVVKLASDGTIQWQKFFIMNDSKLSDSNGITQLSDGSYIILGQRFTMKLDSSGNIVWQKNISGTAMYAVSNGVIIVSGENNSIIVKKIDFNGNILWAKQYSVANNNFYFSTNSITLLSTGALVVVGRQRSGEVYNIFAMKIDGSGNLTWARTYDSGSNDDSALSVADAGSGKVLVAGLLDWFTDGAAIMLDTNGSISWNKVYSSPITAICDITKVSNGFVYAGYYADLANNRVLTSLMNVDSKGLISDVDVAYTQVSFTTSVLNPAVQSITVSAQNVNVLVSNTFATVNTYDPTEIIY